MSGLAQTRHFTHFQFNVGIKHAVGEDAALGQEAAVLIEAIQRLVQAVADGWNQRIFLGRQM